MCPFVSLKGAWCKNKTPVGLLWDQRTENNAKSRWLEWNVCTGSTGTWMIQGKCVKNACTSYQGRLWRCSCHAAFLSSSRGGSRHAPWLLCPHHLREKSKTQMVISPIDVTAHWRLDTRVSQNQGHNQILLLFNFWIRKSINNMFDIKYYEF